MAHGPFYQPYIVGIESAVTDKLYPGGQDELAELFVGSLHRLLPTPAIPLPRSIGPGDNITVLADDFHRALYQFGLENGLIAPLDNPTPDAIEATGLGVLEHLFGHPTSAPGGALANSMAAIFASRVDNQPVADGVFITAVGDDAAGQHYVRETGRSHIIAAAHGRQMEAHILPMGPDNRLIVACPRNAQENSMNALTPEFVRSSLEQCQRRAFGHINRLMVGGYLHLLGERYADVMQTIIDFIHTLPQDKRPDVVMTLASHEAAENPVLQDAFLRLSQLTNVTVHANTGEFRRLIGRGIDGGLVEELGLDEQHTFDSVWRVPFDLLWFDDQQQPLQGKALDKAKRATPDYMTAKEDANRRAFAYASSHLCTHSKHEVNFVVTDGGKPPVIVDSRGAHAYEGLEPFPDNQPMYTVGAGDAFAGGYQAMDLFQLAKGLNGPHSQKHEARRFHNIHAGHAFAHQVLEVPSARAPDRSIVTDCAAEQVRIDGPMADAALLDVVCEGVERKRA
ncbi:hypothetical protein GC177_02685 [bacterium]|nr:hypothetical protein [bacterium]